MSCIPARLVTSTLTVTLLVLATGCSGADGADGADGAGSAPGLSSAGPPSTSNGTTSAVPAAPSQTQPGQTPPSQTPPPPPATTNTGPVTLTALTGRATSLTIQPAPLAALRALGIGVEPVGGARQQAAPGGGSTFVFPVTGGQVTVAPSGADPVSGKVQHRGGLRLSALGRSATLQEFVLDADRGQLTATLAGRQVPVLPVEIDSATVTRTGRDVAEVTLADEAVAFDAAAAQELARQLRLPALPAADLGQLQVVLTGS